MGFPLLRTRTTTWPSSRDMLSVTVEPGLEYLQALSKSWLTASRKSSRSAITSLDSQSFTTEIRRAAESLVY